MGALLLACLLALLGDDPVAQRLAELRAEPARLEAWSALAQHEEPGEALRAVRALLQEVTAPAAGWHALWQLADRVGDYPLGAEARRRALDGLEQEERLAEAERAEEVLCHQHFVRGSTLAERQGYERRRALLVRLGRDTRQVDERLARIDSEIHRRAHPDPAALRARIAEARARSDAHAEHGPLVDLAYHLWATGEARAGLEAYRRVLAIHARETREQRANDENGAARMALETALTASGAQRDELLAEALAHGLFALEEHEANGVGGPADRVRDHCVLAHVREALGERDEARAHHEAELALVLETRRSVALESDQALRLFHGVEHHIFEDFALFLAHEEPPDLARALRVGEIGRVGGLRELYRLRGLSSPSWTDQELSVTELGRRAGAETAVLVYHVGSHAAELVCLRADGLRAFPLAPPQELERAAEAFARTAFDLAAKDAELEREGRRAYELFLAPAAEALAGVKRLVLVGAGRFGRMPFAALVGPGEEALARRYLSQRFELAFAPTLGALTAARAPAAAGPSVSLGCDGAGTFGPELVAHFGLGGLARLTRAEAEAKAVARALGGRAVHGRAATEEAFRQAARASGILHFAGHALVDDEDGTKSALVLAPPAEAGGDDGLLTLGELLELPIDARLVILSACRTARGETFAGEGVGGMARCLLAAGARNLLLTLAPLDDAKAPVFLAHFSAALAEGASPATALARAQRRMLAKKSDAHPAFWASFALYGQEDLLR